jgi:hypothetical protein
VKHAGEIERARRGVCGGGGVGWRVGGLTQKPQNSGWAEIGAILEQNAAKLKFMRQRVRQTQQ